MNWDKSLYYASTRLDGFQERHWESLYPQLPPSGKFWLDLVKCFTLNWFVARQGEWSTPWPSRIVPGFEMPPVPERFSLSFAEVTDRRAHDIRQLIQRTDAPIAVYYSGGIDSTICLCALIRNLTPEELKRIHVCMNADSVIENPSFFQKFIEGKMPIIDSAKTKYADLLNKGFYAITADQGDCLFGTEAALQLYFTRKNLLDRLSGPARRSVESALLDVNVSEAPFRKFADVIRLHFSVERNPQFGTIFYEQVLRNIDSSEAPIYSLHDFFWWLIFNLKYMHCALRSVVFYFGNGRDYRRALHEQIINWFNHPDYQRWSLSNNNNGQKIRGSSPTSYKWAGRQYIYSVDHNPWYLNHKLKIMSLAYVLKRSSSILDNLTTFGIDEDYQILLATDPKVLAQADYSLHHFRLEGT